MTAAGALTACKSSPKRIVSVPRVIRYSSSTSSWKWPVPCSKSLCGGTAVSMTFPVNDPV